MADALVSFVLEQLSSIIVSEIGEEVSLVVGVKNEVKKLQTNLEAIRGVLADAEEKQLKEISVKQWLDELKDVSYRMDDVLDEWSTALLKSRLEEDDHGSPAKPKSRKVLPFIKSSCFCCRKVSLRHGVARKIKELNEMLIDIKNRKEMFSFDVGKGAMRQPERRVTTSPIDITEMHGRKREKETIVNILLSESSQSQLIPTSTVSIVGAGGIGKTTLARLAFNDDTVNSYFNKTIWVCVSKPFESIRIAKAILESLSVDCQRFGDLENIMKHIKETIAGKRFLIVLDDMWEDGPEKWGELKYCLSGGLQGSKILVTTRSDIVATNMGCTRTNLFRIGKLPPEECWSIFSLIAFFDRDDEKRRPLETVGREIVKKCDGLPLAAKALGSLMRLKSSVQDWRNVLDSELWELPEIWEANSGLASLWLSYYDLPSELRQCFTYCAIFPEDYKINKRKLVEMWMAQGYLGKNSSKKDMYTYGREHFQNLSRRGFFQGSGVSSDGETRCSMHDVMRDFAQYLGKNECFSMEIINSEKDPPLEQCLCKEGRHLRMVLPRGMSIPSSICGLTNLRTLWIQSPYNHDIGAGLSNMFEKLTSLRSLILHGCDIEDIPSSISKLIHLRQLDLACNYRLKKLPESVCQLYNLQTLDVSDCLNLILPQGMEKLINLRHLYNRWNNSVLPKPIGRLSCLRILKEFIVSSDTEPAAASIGDLKNLNQLHGSLWIKGLENLGNVGEAKEAQLQKKTQITELAFYFGDEETEGKKHHDEELSQGLEPPPNVEDLSILGYQGVKFPRNLVMPLNNLRELYLRCGNCENLPSLWKLPSLEVLELSWMKGVKTLDAEFIAIEIDQKTGAEIFSSDVVSFSRLKTLKFYDMPNWEDWDSVSITTEFKIMPCLGCLEVHRCPMLKVLPNYIFQMTTLNVTIVGCHALRKRHQWPPRPVHNQVMMPDMVPMSVPRDALRHSSRDLFSTMLHVRSVSPDMIAF